MNDGMTNLSLKPTVSVGTEQGEYFLCRGEEWVKIKNNYLPVAKLLEADSCITVAKAEAVLEESGVSHIAAGFTVGQFMVDYADFIE